MGLPCAVGNPLTGTGDCQVMNAWVYQRQIATVGRRSGIHDKRGFLKLPTVSLMAGDNRCAGTALSVLLGRRTQISRNLQRAGHLRTRMGVGELKGVASP